MQIWKCCCHRYFIINWRLACCKNEWWLFSKRCCWYQINGYLGLLTPSIRCTVHAADGSIKCLTNSKTRNLQVISDFLPNLHSILRHFQSNGKSTHLLNEALELMEMKFMHVMSFCPTRMSYILTACSQVVKQLVAICLCNSQYKKGTKKSIFIT